MIEINLSTTENKLKLPVVLGADLNLLNKKLLIAFIILSFVPNFFIIPYFQETETKASKRVVDLRTTLRALKKKTRGQEAIQAQIDKLEHQETYFLSTINVVKNILKIKKSPFNLMLYMIKNIPEDLWFESVSLNKNELKIEGRSLNFKSIGKFINHLKKSVFFEGNVRIIDSGTILDEQNDRRVEKFSIVAVMEGY